jgi:hypothetical protein
MGRNAEDYFAALPAPQCDIAAALRRAILDAGAVSEAFKWGHPVYEAGSGPVALIKSHKKHLTFGLWRGAQMGEIDSRLEPGGGFQMAYIRLTTLNDVKSEEVRRLIVQGVALNDSQGDPTKSSGRATIAPSSMGG